MNNQSHRETARGGVDLVSARANRRDVLRTLGRSASAALMMATNSPLLPVKAAPSHGVRHQETPADAAPGGPRLPGGPTVEEKAAELQYDPERIFRFVADEVAYEAYPGALRGPMGTLWGLAGNSVDQAQLLAALLDQALVPTRFVVGELNDDATKALVDATRLDATATRVQLARTLLPPSDIATDRAWSSRLTADQVALLHARQAKPEELVVAARTQLDDGLQLIETALREVGASLPPADLTLPERETTQHVWLQYADGPAWIDLDPTMPDAKPGATYARQTEIWDSLAPELFHAVRFRVVAETISGGQPLSSDVLAYEARSQDLVGVTISLGHVEAEALRAAGVAISGAIAGTLQYIPHLLVGDVGEEGTPVTIVTGEGALDVLGASTTEGDTLAEWLIVEIMTPDAPPTVVTREIFDRIGIDQRATGVIDVTNLPPAQLVDIPPLGTIFLPLETVWIIAVVGQQVHGNYYQQNYAVEDLATDFAFAAHTYHTIRDVWQIAIGLDRGYRFYPDQPNVTAAAIAAERISEQGDRAAVALDLLHQGHGIAPIAGTAPTVDPRVLAGVLSHVAERLTLDDRGVASPTSPLAPVISVGRVFEEAARAGVAVKVLPPGTTAPADLAVSPIAKARINEALTAGYLVIVPERAVTIAGEEAVGWWQVDPMTGRTFDLMENGRGAAGPMSEDMTIIIPRVRAARLAYRRELAIKIVYFIMGAIIGLSATAAVMTHP